MLKSLASIFRGAPRVQGLYTLPTAYLTLTSQLALKLGENGTSQRENE